MITEKRALAYAILTTAVIVSVFFYLVYRSNHKYDWQDKIDKDKIAAGNIGVECTLSAIEQINKEHLREQEYINKVIGHYSDRESYALANNWSWDDMTMKMIKNNALLCVQLRIIDERTGQALKPDRPQNKQDEQKNHGKPHKKQ